LTFNKNECEQMTRKNFQYKITQKLAYQHQFKQFKI